MTENKRDYVTAANRRPAGVQTAPIICGECYADRCWSCEGDCSCLHPPLGDECSGCSESFTRLPVVDSENGQSYCSDDCRDRASERYWTAVWTA